MLDGEAVAGGVVKFGSWWENLGVSPSYRNFPVAFRLKGQGRSETVVVPSDIRTWLPGDSVLDGQFTVPADLPAGRYDVSLALVDVTTKLPRAKSLLRVRFRQVWQCPESTQCCLLSFAFLWCGRLQSGRTGARAYIGCGGRGVS